MKAAGKFLIMAVLLCFSGFFSGLNLAYLEIEVKYLELLIMGPYESKSEEKLAKYAKVVLPLRKRGNLLLTTILIGNISVNAGLSILMAQYTTGLFGLLIATFLIVIFGEILP